jgi:hypothetical protein
MRNGASLRLVHLQRAVQRWIEIKQCESHFIRLAEFKAKRKRSPPG